MRLPTGFILASAFVLGVALESSGLLAPVFALIAGVVAVLCLWFNDRRSIITGALFLALVISGALRVHSDNPFPPGAADLSEVGQFTGVVLDVPRFYPTSTTTRIELSEPVETRVWAALPSYPVVRQGDELVLSGSYVPNEVTSFRGFAARRDTSGVLTSDSIEIQTNHATTAQRWRATLGDEISSRLQIRIPEPAGAFATGVILGDDGAMTSSTRDAFRVGGLTHMTAVSGVHVGIVAAAILLVSRLGLIHRWWMLGISVPVVWSFAYLVGMRPSVVRASLMLTLLVIANLLGRPRDTLNAVGLAAAAMLIVNPSLRHDIGFQLSIAATTGIALGILLLGRQSHWHLVWVVPLAAQLATEPLILYHFGYYSLVSPIANVLATPFLALTMGMSIVTVLTSVVSSTLADAFALGTWAPAYAVVLIADSAASLPYLSGDVRPLNKSGVWSAYALLAGVVALLFLVLEGDPSDEDEDVSLLYRV